MMDFQKLIAEVAKILRELRIPYAVTGGYAISIWGRPRSTFDIDVIIELPIAKIPSLAIALKRITGISYVDEGMMIRAVERKGEFNYIHADSGIKVDFFVQDKDPFATLKFKRRIPKKIAGETVHFVSPEDLILSKLLWHKESDSERQLSDISSVLKRQKKLDWKYLRKWSTIQSTDKVLESLRKSDKNK